MPLVKSSLFNVHPPIVLRLALGVPIAPVDEIDVTPLVNEEFDSVHPPIVLEVPGPLEISPPLN